MNSTQTMRRVLSTSIQALRAPIARVPAAPRVLLPLGTRHFNQTTRIVEPLEQPPQPEASSITASQASSTIISPSSTPSSSSPTTPLSDSIKTLLPLLAAQPAHYVTAHIHGRPYLVTAGDQVRLPFRMPGVQPGDVLRLNRASVLGSRDYTLKGQPFVDERLFECRAVVLGTESEPMRVAIKKKQRSRRKKHVRSKHRFTVLRISEVRVNDGVEL